MLTLMTSTLNSLFSTCGQQLQHLLPILCPSNVAGHIMIPVSTSFIAPRIEHYISLHNPGNHDYFELYYDIKFPNII